ncbi:hypothetical protein ABPG73_018817 [Tetrahymena malaccensis]
MYKTKIKFTICMIRYMLDDYNKRIDIIIDIFSILFKSINVKGLYFLIASKYDSKSTDIIIVLIQGYYLRETYSNISTFFKINLIISQKQNYSLYSIYRNPYENITETSSDELPHYKLRSIKEQEVSQSKSIQKRLDKHFSKRIDQKSIINIDIRARKTMQTIYFNRFFLKKYVIAENKNTKKLINSGIRKVYNKSRQPILSESYLYSAIKQLKEKNDEFKGLYKSSQYVKKEEKISTLLKWLATIKIDK